MNIDELRHLIAEAARLTGEEYIYIIGSSALLGTIEHPADTVLTRSREADIVPGSNDQEKADKIDWVLGELSAFDKEFRYYAQGVSLETPSSAPRGWEARTVRLPVSREVTGLCMDVHDLAISKYGAWRPKDRDFTRALAKEAYVQKEILLERLALVECDDVERETIRARISGDFSGLAEQPR
ncbi:MAG TPA: DUF6036 family nucleotidyltransferase [Gammaproteobacteria bacterium]